MGPNPETVNIKVKMALWAPFLSGGGWIRPSWLAPAGQGTTRFASGLRGRILASGRLTVLLADSAQPAKHRPPLARRISVTRLLELI